MSYETMTFEQEGPIGIITLRRPERLNAINVQMLEELRLAIDHIQNDDVDFPVSFCVNLYCLFAAFHNRYTVSHLI